MIGMCCAARGQHPHSALGFQPPEVFAKTFNNPKLSLPLD